MDLTCCGDADAAAEAPPRLIFTISLVCILFCKRTKPPERRKERISWKTLFPVVANVAKVI
jgi:hypothetical protein